MLYELSKRPRVEQCYCYVIHQLNRNGLYPAGRTIQQWIVEQLGTIQKPSTDEIASLLTGLLQERAITQADINRLNQCRACT